MIRKIKITDAEYIKSISELSLGYKSTLEIVKKQILKFKDGCNHIIFVYEDESTNKVVGYIHAESYENLYCDGGVNILALAVLPEFQGKGIGRELLLEFEKQVKDKGYKFVRLNSGNDRKLAHKFYENNGYNLNKLQKRFSKNF